jgi:hypothetical protein
MSIHTPQCRDCSRDTSQGHGLFVDRVSADWHDLNGNYFDGWICRDCMAEIDRELNASKLILDVCGGTGSWSQPYRDAGYTVIVLDPEAFTDNAGGAAIVGGSGDVCDPRYHVQGCFGMPVHGILLAPPCTEFASSGARWWKGKAENSPELLADAIKVAQACLDLVAVHKPAFWVLENPRGSMRRLLNLGATTAVVQPHQFAGYATVERNDCYTKETFLWGAFTVPTKDSRPPVLGSKMHTQYGGKSARTKRMRSATPEGFARAFYIANP